MGECISCGKCSDVCPLTNIGMIRIAEPAVDAASGSAKAAKAPKAAGARALDCKIAPEAKALSGIGASTGVKASVSTAVSASATTVSVRKKVLLRGNEIGYTLLKAVLLLVFLWIVGALGFAPSFAETTGIQLPWG